jgi:L-seryl-tRNA(Ser) seleniumtransferase
MNQHDAAPPRVRDTGRRLAPDGRSPRDATSANRADAREPELRELPSVDDVLRSPAGEALLARHPRWAVTAAARALIADRRALIRAPGGRAAASGTAPITEAELGVRVGALRRPSLRPVINATGVVLHTNLGRAPLADRALGRVAEVGRGYSTLEYDPERRGRGSRHDHLGGLLAALTGAEAAAVVNNNAGAVLVSLAALAAGREVVVSRGELVEIGGGFRVPDVMRASGATLVEVGTTNKTRLADYLAATGERTALYLKVHRSNFALVGFTEEAPVGSLHQAGAPRGIPVMVDLGSGALVDTAALGLPAEPTVGAAVAAGADLCTFSGDKLLGGPQAGIIVGRRELVARVLAHPLMRALRPDKLTLAALEATLEIYRDGAAADEIPTLQMLAASADALATRKDRLVAALAGAAPGVGATPCRVRSAVGGGALPLAEPETWAVALGPGAAGADDLAAALAAGEPAVVARIADGRVLLDVRTVADDEVEALAGAVARAAAAAQAVAEQTR